MSSSYSRAPVRVVMAVVALVTILFVTAPSPVVAAPTQVTDTSIDPESPSTSRDLLIPGDGSDGAESTTTSTTTIVKASEAASDGLSETTAVWAIVAGLVLVAGGIVWWTVHYWRKTAPRARPEKPVRPSRPRSPTSKSAGVSRQAVRKVEPGATTRTTAERKLSARPVAKKAVPKSGAPQRRPMANGRRRPIEPGESDGREPLRR